VFHTLTFSFQEPPACNLSEKDFDLPLQLFTGLPGIFLCELTDDPIYRVFPRAELDNVGSSVVQ
jgi:hypothetical protein